VTHTASHTAMALGASVPAHSSSGVR